VLKNGLLIVASLAVVIVAFEALLWARPELRAASAGPSFVFCQGASQRYQQHPVFRKAEIPESVYFEHNGERWSIHLNNDLGFRDVFDSGDRHAIILGDSFTRGTSLHEHQTIPYLLDLWTPDVAFHSFGIGGSGTVDAYRVYQAIGQHWDHRLVVLNYFLGNDLRNNLAGDVELDGDEEQQAQLGDVPMESAAKSLLTRAHRSIRAHSQVYNLAYTSAKIIAGGRRGDQLPPAEFETAARITRRVLLSLGRAAGRNDADLLIVIIPSWNEITEVGAEDLPEVQREMIGQVADEIDNVFVLDLSAEIRGLGARQVYGQVDKHLNPFGAYTAARSIYQWTQRDWPNGPRTEGRVPPFEDDDWEMTRPDCALVEGYRQRLLGQASRA
jgi:hypothetical protein